MMWALPSVAEPVLDISYDKKEDVLNLNLEDVFLDDVLKQLSKEIGFTLKLEGDDIHRKVTLSMTDDSAKVVTQLIKPNNVILSQSDTKPHKLTNVILLPVGEQSREMRIREKMPAPRPSGNADKDRKRQKHHERRIQRKMMGLGRHADSILSNDPKNDSLQKHNITNKSQ
jgi:hypothetical protein